MATGRAASAGLAKQARTSELALPQGGLDIDGSILEGGGQILRNAAALASITGRPVCIDKIRAQRSKPGLRPQHLAGLQMVARICQGQLSGDEVGSCTIVLAPDVLRAGEYAADPGTAGSCALLAQAALPCLLFSQPDRQSEAGADVQSFLSLKGGTDASMAPPVGYLQHVLLPMLHGLFGIRAELQLFKRGFYPKGGGSLRLGISSLRAGSCLPRINLTERASWDRISIRAFTAGKVDEAVGQRMVHAARQTLRQELGRGVHVDEDLHRENPQSAVGDGCGILITATTRQGLPILGSSGLGERGIKAEAVGETAARALAEDIATGACVDRWMQDQLIVFMALADGTSEIACGEPTLHTRTAMVIAERLTSAKFWVVPPPSQGQPYTIRCRGAKISADPSGAQAH